MTLLLVFTMLALGVLYAELYHRARKLVFRHYPDFVLEDEKRWREQYYRYPGMFIGIFNSEANGITDLIYSTSSRHAIPLDDVWIFDALFLNVLAIKWTLGLMFVYAMLF
jgi:hypothetical protein